MVTRTTSACTSASSQVVAGAPSIKRAPLAGSPPRAREWALCQVGLERIRPLARLMAVRRLVLGAAVIVALAAPGLARAELIPGSAGAQDSLLAIRTDGTPLVAYVAADNNVVL